MPGLLSPSLCTQLSHRIFVYAQQVAFANARHRLNDNNGGANKVMAFVEIEEPELKPIDNDRVQDYTGGVWADLHDDGGIVLYFANNEESSKPPRGGLKQERFKNDTSTEEESLMCSFHLFGRVLDGSQDYAIAMFSHLPP
nr:uncharacterized protein LOC109187344 [Ipomoea trifida]